MGVDWLGGGLVLALAAVLWLVYLVPTWFRRNEYMAIEKNAVRLQQTLRILAETSEVPDEVRIEANARSVVEQQRRLKRVIMDNTPEAVLQARKIRRSRGLTSLLLLVAAVVTLLGAMQIALTGAWLIMLAGAVVSVACVLRLGKLARMGRALRLPAPTGQVRVPVAQAFADHGADFESAPVDDAEVESAEWTPVEIPRPLYLNRRAPEHTRVAASAPVEPEDVDAAADRLRTASLRAQEALRQAAVAEAARADDASLPSELPDVALPPVVEAPASPAAPSRYASMGIVEAEPTSSLDLDSVLARRRAV